MKKELKGVDNSTVVHCKTENESKKVLKIADNAGYFWHLGESLLTGLRWFTHKENTYYRLNLAGVTFGKISILGNEDKIISAAEFIALNSPNLADTVSTLTNEQAKKVAEHFQNERFEPKLQVSAEGLQKIYQSTLVNTDFATDSKKQCKRLLEDLFGKDFFVQDIRDKVKTYEDALEVYQKNNPHKNRNPFYEERSKQGAFERLLIIADVLNEGWVCDWKDQFGRVYAPDFKIENGEFIYNKDLSQLPTGLIMSQFYYKSAELAEYAGTQFLDLFKTLLMP